MMADGKNVNFVFTLSDDDGQYIFYITVITRYLSG